MVATPTPATERRTLKKACSVPIQLKISICPPTCLLSLSSSFLLFLPLLLVSSSSSKHLQDGVMRTQFQINRLQRVMMDRGGYERWGGGEWGIRVSMTTAQDSCLMNEGVCAHLYVWHCVYLRISQ